MANYLITKFNNYNRIALTKGTESPICLMLNGKKRYLKLASKTSISQNTPVLKFRNKYYNIKTTAGLVYIFQVDITQTSSLYLRYQAVYCIIDDAVKLVSKFTFQWDETGGTNKTLTLNIVRYFDNAGLFVMYSTSWGNFTFSENGLDWADLRKITFLDCDKAEQDGLVKAAYPDDTGTYCYTFCTGIGKVDKTTGAPTIIILQIGRVNLSTNTYERYDKQWISTTPTIDWMFVNSTNVFIYGYFRLSTSTYAYKVFVLPFSKISTGDTSANGTNITNFDSYDLDTALETFSDLAEWYNSTQTTTKKPYDPASGKTFRIKDNQIQSTKDNINWNTELYILSQYQVVYSAYVSAVTGKDNAGKVI